MASTKYEATPLERFMFRWACPGMLLVVSLSSWWWMLAASFDGAPFHVLYHGGLGYVMWRGFRYTASKRSLFASPAPEVLGPSAERID